MENKTLITDGITTGVETRKQRGLEISKIARIDRKEDGTFTVPSMSGNGRYVVDVTQGSCSCPDHEERHCKCKHQWAVEFASKRETTHHEDGTTTVTETVAIKAVKKATYPQNWPQYNAAQTNEQDQFLRLLADLCSNIETPAQQGRGQRRLPLSDAVFSVVFKVYSTFSGRRFMSDLRAAHTSGRISKVPHYNSIFHYLENPDLFTVLRDLIVESAKPLASVESDFAADSSGFSTSRFVRWFDQKYGQVRVEHDWVKVHAMCGTKTNVVTAVEIKERNAGDVAQFPALVKTTAENFTMKEVSADKAYLSVENMRAATRVGATPFIAFKSNSTPRGGGIWRKMYHYFQFQRDEYMSHYHKRSNIESTFSMIKAKFGDAIRSKTDVAMKNEALCKILCHNICCLISAIYELGIDPQFGKVA